VATATSLQEIREQALADMVIHHTAEASEVDWAHVSITPHTGADPDLAGQGTGPARTGSSEFGHRPLSSSTADAHRYLRHDHRLHRRLSAHGVAR
jgi:hypothetical protein